MDRRIISNELYVSFENRRVYRDFTKVIDKLTAFQKRVEESLECKKMKAYFMHKILKLKGSWLKKGLKHKALNISRNECVEVYNEALSICMENFRKSWLTIDCYNQLGKLHWSLKENKEATQAFDNAIELATYMSLRNSMKFATCLVDKGRFLISSRIKENMEEGRVLLEDVIGRCKDFVDNNFWFKSMEFLLKVDQSKAGIVKERYLHTDQLNSRFYEYNESSNNP